MTEPAKPAAEQVWRVGGHYRIHVYEQDESQINDRPVATFHREEDAMRAVFAFNTLYGGSDD